MGSSVKRNSGIAARIAATPASSVECERNPLKCSRTDSSRPARAASAMPQPSSRRARLPSLRAPATISTSPASTHSSTSGTGAHGAGGASSMRARRLTGRPGARPPEAGVRASAGGRSAGGRVSARRSVRLRLRRPTGD